MIKEFDFLSICSGGKVKSNESLKEALIREIKEELNISISVQDKIAEELYQDNKINVHLFYFLCLQLNDTIELREHEKMAWGEKKEFRGACAYSTDEFLNNLKKYDYMFLVDGDDLAGYITYVID